jgi:hypothetical protein
VAGGVVRAHGQHRVQQEHALVRPLQAATKRCCP